MDFPDNGEGGNASPRQPGSQIKRPVPCIDYFFLRCSMGSHRSPANITGITAIPELDGKNLLLNAMHVWITWQRESKLVLTWQLHPCWLLFIILNGSSDATKEEKLLVVLSSYEVWNLQQWSTRPSTSIGSIVGMNVMAVMNSFLNGFKTCSTRENSHLIPLNHPEIHG